MHWTVSTFLTHNDRIAGDVVAALRHERLVLDDPHPTTRTVLDTFDGRLHAAGLRLELRDVPSRELVLTGPGGAPPAHLAWDRDAPPRLGGDLPPGPFGARIARVIVERALVPVARVTSTSRRAVRSDRRGAPVVTVTVHDDLRLDAPPEVTLPALVVEVVATVGQEREIDDTVALLLALDLDRDHGDLVDAVVRSAGRSLAGHTSSPTVPLRRKDDSFDAFRAVLRNLLTSIEDNLPGTLADLDTEFLHDLRVAIRRTRSVLTEGKKVLPADVRDHYRTAFADLAAATSRTRDLDVYVLGWHDTVAELGLDDPAVTLPVLKELRTRRRVALAGTIDVLRSDATRELLGSWQAWLDDPDARAEGAMARSPIGPYIAGRIAKAQASLLRDGRAITPESPAERLHDLRKDAKKLRYLFECFGSLLPAGGRKAFVHQLKALQDNLGLHQDAEIQVAELRELAHDLRDRNRIGTDALLVVGRLIDHLERVRLHERDAFVDRFRAYDSKDNRELLDALLDKTAGR